MSLSEEKRSQIILKAAARFLTNLETMSYGRRLDYMQNIVRQLDDKHLTTLEFAIEMTPPAGFAHTPEPENQLVQCGCRWMIERCEIGKNLAAQTLTLYERKEHTQLSEDIEAWRAAASQLHEHIAYAMAYAGEDL